MKETLRLVRNVIDCNQFISVLAVYCDLYGLCIALVLMDNLKK